MRSIEGSQIMVEWAGQRGPIVETTIPLDMLAAALRVGEPIEVYVFRSKKPGEAEFSTRDLDARYRTPTPAAATAEPVPVSSRPPPAPAAPHDASATSGDEGPSAQETKAPEAACAQTDAAVAPTPPEPGSGAQGAPARVRTLPEPSAHAVVLRIDGPRDIVVRSGECEGRLLGPVLLLESYARTLKPGQALPSRVRRTRAAQDGILQFELVSRPGAHSTVAAASMRQAWRKVAGAWGCKAGDIVRGRVVALHGEQGAEIEVYPEVVLSLPLEQVDWEVVKPRQLPHLLPIGKVLLVKVTHLDPDACAGQATLRYVHADERAGFPLPGIDTCFLHDEPTTLRLREDKARERKQALEQMRRAKAAEGEARQRRLQQKQEAERRDELAAEPRRMQERNLRAQLLASPEAFLAGMHSAYARTFTADDRKDYPLATVHIGREFLGSVQALQGISITKVVDVSVEVACGYARAVEGREVHRLRSGPAGNAPPRVRTRDDATAWRCALQVKTPGARRLHWWEVRSTSGRVIELACVGHHDDMHIPE